LPLVAAELDDRSTAHCEFCSRPLPNDAAIHVLPSSSRSESSAAARSNDRAQALASVADEAPKRTAAMARSTAPAESEYCSTKRWLAPVPLLGDTETAPTNGAAGPVIVQVNERCTVTVPSNTEIVTVVAPADSGVPVTRPVDALMARPVGRPLAENDSVPPSGSLTSGTKAEMAAPTTAERLAGWVKVGTPPLTSSDNGLATPAALTAWTAK
jgi:hypothetical protein